MVGETESRKDGADTKIVSPPSVRQAASAVAPALYSDPVAGECSVSPLQRGPSPTPCPPPRGQAFFFMDANAVLANEAGPGPWVETTDIDQPLIWIWTEIFDGDLPGMDTGKRTMLEQAQESGRFVRMMLGPYMHTGDILVCLVGATWPDTVDMRKRFITDMAMREGWALGLLRRGFAAPHCDLNESIERMLL